MVDEPGRHLLQLARHGGRVGRDDLRRSQLQHQVALHHVVGPDVGHVARQLDRVERRQLVGVDARLQHERGGLDRRHDLLQRPLAGRPLAEVAVDADEVALQERALGPAQQRLIDDLALAEHVLQTVGRERPGQAPAVAHALEELLQRLEPLPAGVLDARQLVKHDAVEAGHVGGGQRLDVVVVHHDHGGVGRQRRRPLCRCADRQRHRQPWCPLGPLDRPHVGADPLGREDQPAPGVAVRHRSRQRRERDGGLARADWREDHGCVVLEQEVGSVVLVRSKAQRQGTLL